MTEEGLRAAIVAPARQLGVELEAGLPERLIDDLRGAPQPLPLLQFTLSELWARRVNASLTHAAYEAIGGVDNALAHYADSVVERLGRDAERLRWVLVQLVRPGEGMDDTRQVVTHAQIRETDWPLIVRLADARLVVTGRNEATGQETAELVHEALIRHWQPLRQWVDEMRQFRTWQNRVRQAIQEWDEKQRDEGALLRGARLVEAEQHLQTHAEVLGVAEHAYIEASLELRRREELERRRRRRKVVAGLVLGLVLVSGAASWAIIQWHKANIARHTAEEQRKRAVARHLAAEARLLLSEGTGRGFLQSGLLAAESLKQAHTLQGSSLWSDVMALLPSRVTTFPHRCEVGAIALSPNGDRLASSGGEGDCDATRVWDVASKKEILQLIYEGLVNDVMFDPEGRYLGTAGADGTARLWDTTTGSERARLQHEDEVWRLVFSHNGKTVATASADKTVRLWDTATGKELLQLPHDVSFPGVVAFSPDDTRIATAGRREKIAHIWDTTTGSEVYRLPHNDCESCELSSKVVFSPDGRVVATTIRDSADRGFVGLWDARSGKLLAQLQIEDRPWIEYEALAFSADGAYLASASDGNAHIWDVQERKEKNKFTVRQGIRSVSFSPDGARLVTIDKCHYSTDYCREREGGAARIWDPFAAPARELAMLAHDGEVDSAVFAPDNTHVATSSRDTTLRLWELPQPKEPREKERPGGSYIGRHRGGEIPGIIAELGNGAIRVWDVFSGTDLARIPREAGFPRAVVFTPHVKLIATTTEIDKEQLRILDAATGGKIAELPHEDLLRVVEFSPDGHRVATICCTPFIGRIWDIPSGEELWRFPPVGHISSYTFAFSPSGKYIVASGGDDNTARVWNLVTHKEVASLKHEGEVRFVDFSHDGKWLITADTSKHATIWDSHRWAVLTRLPHDIELDPHAIKRFPRISTNSSRLATAVGDRTVQLWNTHHWTRLSRLHLKEKIWPIVDFTPDGTYVATWSFDQTFQVWDALTGNEVLRQQHSHPYWFFSRDGRWLVSAEDRIMWRPKDLIAEACSRLPRNLTQEEWRRFLGDAPYRLTCPDK